MIKLDKLWDVMREKGISQYQLIYDYGFSKGQLDRIKKNNIAENVNK